MTSQLTRSATDGYWRAHPGQWSVGLGAVGASQPNEVFALGNQDVSFTAETSADNLLPIVSGSDASYVNAWPGVNLTESVGDQGVKETIVLNDSASPSRFAFRLTGASARPNASGGLDVETTSGSSLGSVPAPVVKDALGDDITTASGAALTVSGQDIVVSLSQGWLSSLPSSAFPVSIDPYFQPASQSSPTSVVSFSSSGTTATTIAYGHNTYGSWDGAFYIKPPAPPAEQDGQPWLLTYADLSLACSTACTASLYNDATKPTTYSAVQAGAKVGNVTPSSNGLDARLETDTPYTSGATYWLGVAANEPSGTYGTIPANYISVEFNYTEAPPTPVLTAPTTGSVLSTATPTLAANVSDPYLCPNSGTQPAYCDSPIDLYYRFRIDTSPLANTGQTVADSGWISWKYTQNASGNDVPINPTWAVPSGSLIDGGSYYAYIQVANDPQYPSPPWSYLAAPAIAGAPSAFTVKLRLGAGGPSPTDTIGAPPGQGSSTPSAGSPSPGLAPAGETVDLVTGNLALYASTPSLNTLSGPAGVNLQYNSSEASSMTGANYGLTAQFFHDPGTHVFPSTAVGKRIEPQVNAHGSAAYPPIGGIAPYTAYLGRWTGQLSLPAGTWELGGTSSGGMRIFVNGSTTPVLNGWAGGPSAVTYSSTAITGPASVPIEVDDWDANQNTATTVQLWARDTSTSAPSATVVPSSWLTPSAQGLPPGWRLASTATPAWSKATDLGAEVVLSSPTGATAVFTRNADGSYTATHGNTDYLSTVNGNLELSTSSGLLYTFGSDGSLAAATTVADETHPTSLQYTYGSDTAASSSTIVLQSITDPVSGRTVTLGYGNASGCSTPNAAGLLCDVQYWDGTSAQLGYNSNDQLAEIVDPGNVTTLFAYNTTNQLAEIRDDLANAVVASGQTLPSGCSATALSSSCSLETSITYDAAGRVSTLTQPAPASGGLQPKRTYSYTAGNTTVRVAGFSSTSGVALAASYDAQSRITSETNSVGLSSHEAWNGNDLPVIAVNPGGLQTSDVYDTLGDLTDTYGPAPVACFDPSTVPSDVAIASPMSGYLPLANAATAAGCQTTVPHNPTGYDEGINGLAVSYWSNGTKSGAAALHGTGSGATAPATCSISSEYVNNGTGGSSASTLCADWPAGSAPTATDSQSLWSTRLTGELNWTGTGSYPFYVNASGPFTMYIDGLPKLTNITYSSTGVMTGYTSAPQPVSQAIALTPGNHSIEVDFQGNSTKDSTYFVAWSPNGGNVVVPLGLNLLSPAYGLKTSTVDPDGHATSTIYSSASLGAQYELPAMTTVDPSGLKLVSSATYEAPGTGYLRKLSTTLPGGNTTTYQYYGGTDGPLASVCGVTSSVPQGGELEQQNDPPAASGAADRVQQFVYDAEGRQVGRRVGSSDTIASAGWQCISFDNQNRVTGESWPAVGSAPARTITFTYNVGSNPLSSSVTDSATGSTVTATEDLLGRITNYSDGSGQSTFTSYDQVGRVLTSGGPGGVVADNYSSTTGQLASMTLDGATVATLGYEAATGRLSNVAYSNGTHATIGYNSQGVEDSLVFTNSGGSLVAGDTVTSTPGGRPSSEAADSNGTTLTNPNPAGQSAADYTYDGAGRLTSAYIPGGLESYGYAANPAGDNCVQPLAGANANRTQVSYTATGGAATTTDYCYNGADQLTAESGASTSSQFAYDAHGNQTLDAGTSLTWDASDRLTNSTTAGGATTTYSYDALNRVLGETSGSTTTRYVYGGFSDSAVAAEDGSGQITAQFSPLPGGVMLTRHPTAGSTGVWSYPDLHGNYTVTADATGTPTSAPTSYDPWGQLVGGTSDPQNNNAQSAFGPFGQAGKLTDTTTNITIMGARPYVAAEGRFLSVDPTNGGCANAYVFGFGNPYSNPDLSGMSSCSDADKQRLGEDTLGLVLGGAAAVAGGAAIIAEAPEVALTLGIIAFIAGAGAAIIDLKNCIHGDQEACVGVVLGGIGLIAGAPGAVASPAAGSGLDTAFKLLGSISFSTGLAGFIVDTIHGFGGFVCDLKDAIKSWFGSWF